MDQTAAFSVVASEVNFSHCTTLLDRGAFWFHFSFLCRWPAEEQKTQKENVKRQHFI